MDVKQRIGAVIFITKTNRLNKFILNNLVYLNAIGRPFPYRTSINQEKIV